MTNDSITGSVSSLNRTHCAHARQCTISESTQWYTRTTSSHMHTITHSGQRGQQRSFGVCVARRAAPRQLVLELERQPVGGALQCVACHVCGVSIVHAYARDDSAAITVHAFTRTIGGERHVVLQHRIGEQCRQLHTCIITPNIIVCVTHTHTHTSHLIGHLNAMQTRYKLPVVAHVLEWYAPLINVLYTHARETHAHRRLWRTNALVTCGVTRTYASTRALVGTRRARGSLVSDVSCASSTASSARSTSVRASTRSCAGAAARTAAMSRRQRSASGIVLVNAIAGRTVRGSAPSVSSGDSCR
jgi:hypothetical protein